jgi:phenylacetyl-CoA:acceptor oxidoreductase subunit 2
VATLAGAWFKYSLITRAAFNQGFALKHLPVRGVAHVSAAAPSDPKGVRA